MHHPIKSFIKTNNPMEFNLTKLWKHPPHIILSFVTTAAKRITCTKRCINDQQMIPNKSLIQMTDVAILPIIFLRLASCRNYQLNKIERDLLTYYNVLNLENSLTIALY